MGILPKQKRVADCTLELVRYHQRRSYRAYRSHSERRICELRQWKNLKSVAVVLAPGFYNLWVVAKIRQPTPRKWGWIYSVAILLVGVPVALRLEAQIFRMPNWGLLTALLLPILPVTILLEILSARQRLLDHESAMARLREQGDSKAPVKPS